MKKFLLILVVLGVTAAIAYLLVSRARKTEIDLRAKASDAAESTKESADKVDSAISAN